jgi:8-oxo-dGTP diphosphatase
MQTYACGFLFSLDRTHVLLIRKRRPAWQAEKLNGIGGKIEPGELPAQAMAREFREEAATDIPPERWREVLTLTGRPSANDAAGWRGHFFRAFGDLAAARAVTDEPLEIHPVDSLPPDTIPNLHWMIPLMLDDDVVARFEYVICLHGGV